jgi:hypothetical protein
MSTSDASALVITAHRYRDSPPAQCALAVLARADSDDLALDVLRAVASRRPDLRPLLRPARWSRLVAASLAHRSTAPDLVPVARSLTRSLTSAPSAGGARPRTPALISARLVSTAVHLDIAASVRARGWTTALTSAHQLAVDLGMSRARASRALTAAETWGWLRLLPAHRGAMRPARAPRIAARDRDTVWAANSITEGLLAGPDDRLHDLIASVREPLWAYTEHGHAAYLLAIADAAEVDPKPMGVTRQTAREARALLDSVGDPTAAEARADAADLMGATEAAVAAAERREAELEARRADVIESRERTARVRAVIAALPPIPRAPEEGDGHSTAELRAWRTDADAAVLPRVQDDPALLATWEREARRAQERAGWDLDDLVSDEMTA